MSNAGNQEEYTEKMKETCPNSWEISDSVVPVLTNNLINPWGQNTDDKSLANGHLSNIQPTHTIADEVVTRNDYVDDLLTVASECLVYRDMDVNEAHPAYVPPNPTDVTRGWMSVVIF